MQEDCRPAISYMLKASHYLDLPLPAFPMEKLSPGEVESSSDIDHFADPSERTPSLFCIFKIDRTLPGREGFTGRHRGVVSAEVQIVEGRQSVSSISCHGALPDGRSEAMGCISVYHHCLLAETIYEVGYCAKLPPANTARDMDREDLLVCWCQLLLRPVIGDKLADLLNSQPFFNLDGFFSQSCSLNRSHGKICKLCQHQFLTKASQWAAS
jgi:hypothetical protein